MEKRELVTTRDVRESDMPFIYRSILMGTYHGNRPAKGRKQDSKAPVDFFSSIDQDVFMREYHGFLEAKFALLETKIKIACLVENADVILGFSVYHSNALDFVFVKPDWRRIGIATDLVPKEITRVSGFTRVGDIIRRKKNWAFSPWS
jgi:GNAT superfamily N-acetyltransferase